MGRRGRPQLAARSLDEALHAVYSGTAPSRPRNAFERQAAAKRRGRPIDPVGPLACAVQHVLYLHDTEGRSHEAAITAVVDAMAGALRETRSVKGFKGSVTLREVEGTHLDRANVRRYVKKALARRAVLAYVEDVPAE